MAIYSSHISTQSEGPHEKSFVNYWLHICDCASRECAGKVILIGPFITNNPETPEKLKDLSTLGKVDLILVTHGHGDHIGDTVEIAKSTGAKVTLNADMSHTFTGVGWLPYKKSIREPDLSLQPIGGHFTVDRANSWPATSTPLPQ